MQDLEARVRSVRGYHWRQRECDGRIAEAISRQLELPGFMGRILSSRGVEVEAAADYLHPTIKALLPNPSRLIDMDVAAERLAAAIVAREKVGVFGDYDVDGACASAVIKCFLDMVGTECEIHIPDRILEGYGPNLKALLALKERGAALVITVDCGTVAFAPIEAATNAGLDVIVVDHHIGEVTRPKALAIVNPNQFSETREYGILCAAGVSFLLVVAVMRILKKMDYFSCTPEPELLRLLDTVALATVCDVVPLKGINRAFVAQGLKLLASRSNIGLAALADVSALKEKPSVYHLGFVLGPRINAGGRVGEAGLGARLLTTRDAAEAAEIARSLERYNEERRAIEAGVVEQAILMAERECADLPIVFIGDASWHQGVVGIVAGRLKDLCDKPVMIMAYGAEIAKASCRSVTGVNIGDIIAAARAEGLVKSGGGHAMAAGFTADMNHLPDLKNFIIQRVQSSTQERPGERAMEFDAYIALSGINHSLLRQLEMAAPFGAGNPEAKFVVKEAKVAYAEIVGNGHIKCFLTESDINTGKQRCRVKAMAFRAVENGLADAILNSIGRDIQIYGSVHANNWNGQESPEIVIEDVLLSCG